jgi:uncharacterized protein (TIGR03067 family)
MLPLFALAVAIFFPGCKSAEEIAKEKAAVEADMKLLEGRWTVAEVAGDPDAAGDDEDKDKPKSFEVQIKDGIMRRMSNGDTWQRQKMTIYPMSEPKRVDLVAVKEDGSVEQKKYKVWVKGSKGKPGKYVDRTGEFKQVGLYKVSGDMLELAMSYDEKDRPTEISRGPGRELLKLKRIGKGPEGEKKDGEKTDGEEKKGEPGKLKEPKEEKKDKDK